MLMRTFVRAVLISVALTSASSAFACPIDLAPCEEVATTLQPPAVYSTTSGYDVLSALAVDLELPAIPDVTFADDDDSVAADDQGTAAISQQSELTDTLPILAKDVQGNAEVVVAGENTSSVDPSILSALAHPEFALDGYEDR